jgi:hypothetical protein
LEQNGTKTNVRSGCKVLKHGGQGRNRTADASLFRAALYQLSYLAGGAKLHSNMRSETVCPSSLSGADASRVRPSSKPCRILIYSACWPSIMSEMRLGDVIDDHCVKCRRVTNHSIVSLVNSEAAKVRCRTCYHDHDYRHEQPPPSKKELKKAEAEAQAALAASAADGAHAAEDSSQTLK